MVGDLYLLKSCLPSLTLYTWRELSWTSITLGIWIYTVAMTCRHQISLWGSRLLLPCSDLWPRLDSSIVINPHGTSILAIGLTWSVWETVLSNELSIIGFVLSNLLLGWNIGLQKWFVRRYGRIQLETLLRLRFWYGIACVLEGVYPRSCKANRMVVACRDEREQ